jgi:hypothetical protein
LVVGGWFACLAILAAAIYAAGPDPSRIALLSVSDGMTVTFGSIYLLGTAIAALLTLALAQWAVGGFLSIFELESGARLQQFGGTTIRFRAIVLAAYAAVTLLTCYFLFVALNKTLLCTMPHDSFVYFDGAHRLANGQRQHIDFHTPLGFFCNLLPYCGLKIAGNFAGSMEWGSLIAGTFLLALAVWVTASRLSVAPAIPLIIYLGLLTVVPLGVESSPEKITAAMFYNRFGWSAITLVFLFFLEPRTQSKAIFWLDSACLAALLLFLLYLKITYFLVGAAFLGLLFISSPYNRRVAIASALLVALGVGAMEALYGLNGPYLRDLRMAIQASGANRGAIIPKLFLNIKEFVLVALAIALTWDRKTPDWLYLVYVGFVTAAGLAIIDQNTHPHGVICALAALLVSHEIIRRRISQPSTSHVAMEVGRAKSLACLGLILLFVVQPIVNRCTSMAMIRSALTQVEEPLPGGLNGIIFPKHLWEHFLAGKTRDPITNKVIPARPRFTSQDDGGSYLDSLLDGVNLLEQAGTSGKSVLAFDFVTPFSFILSMKPAVGDHTCIHYGRTMSDDVFSPPEELLGSVDYVMIPRRSRTPATTAFLERTYGPYLQAHFAETKKTDFWVLWTRRDPKPVR